MEQLHQIIFYALLCGAGVFIGVWGWRREIDTAWIVSLASAAAVVWFVFPDPSPVDRIVDAIDNFTLVMYKVFWSVAWFLGSLGIHLVVRFMRYE